MLRQFGAHVAVAIEDARLFERGRGTPRPSRRSPRSAARSRRFSISMSCSARRHARARVVWSRTFGIFLLNPPSDVLEMKLAIRYGNRAGSPQLRVGQGLVGFAAEHKAMVNVPDVTRDPRYLPWVEDCRSELAIPLLIKDRVVGVLISRARRPRVGKHDVEVLTLWPSQVAVAIENAR